jgi:hypothetical protein
VAKLRVGQQRNLGSISERARTSIFSTSWRRTRWRSWLRPQVQFPMWSLSFFINYPFGHTKILELIQPVTEKIYRNKFRGSRRPVRRFDKLAIFMYRLSINSCIINLLEPSGPAQACIGIVLPYSTLAIPLQTLTGPEGSRRLRLPDVKTIDTWRWQGYQLYAPAAFTRRKYSWCSFLLRYCVEHQGHSAAGRFM